MFQMTPNQAYPHLYTTIDFHLPLQLDNYQQTLTIQTSHTQALLEFHETTTLIPKKGHIVVCLYDPTHQDPLHWVVLSEPISIQPHVYFNCLSTDEEACVTLATATKNPPLKHSTRRKITLPHLAPSYMIQEILSIGMTYNPAEETDNYHTGNYVTLLICLLGEYQLKVANETMTLTRGQAILLPPHTHYEWQSIAKDNRLQSIWFVIESRSTAIDYQMIELPAHLTQVMQQLDTSDRALTQDYYIDYLIEQLDRCLLYMHAPSLMSYTNEQIQAQESYENDLIQQMTDFLRDNITDYHEVSDLVDMFHVSRSTIQTLFNEHLNLTPIQYINQLRLDKSRELIETGKFSIQEIAKQLGYGSPQYFSRAFRQQFGLSPSQYAKQITQQF